MTPSLRLRRSGAALALAAGLAALAALAASAPARSATPWYQLEVVIFAEGGESPWGRDDWREEGPPPLPENTVELLAALGAGDEAGGSSRRHAFRALPASQLELGAAAARLDRNDAYRVLLHVGWRQPGSSRGNAPAVHLGTLRGGVGDGRFTATAPGESVDGTIRLWRRQFLHVDLDLAFGDVEAWNRRQEAAGPSAEPGDERREAPVADAVPGTNPDTGGGASAAEPRPPGASVGREEAGAAAEPPPAGSARIRVTRLTRSLRLRAGRLHFLDHPLFGALLMVKRLR